MVRGKSVKHSRCFFGVYLLASESPCHVDHTYIGFTVNPSRRLRQHNGLIANGARKTKSKRPWKMVCIVYGFMEEKSALRFEWAWQNPSMSRILKNVSTKPTGRTYLLLYKLRILINMLSSRPWSRLPLTLHWLCIESQQRFANIFKDSSLHGRLIPDHVVTDRCGCLPPPSEAILTAKDAYNGLGDEEKRWNRWALNKKRNFNYDNDYDGNDDDDDNNNEKKRKKRPYSHRRRSFVVQRAVDHEIYDNNIITCALCKGILDVKQRHVWCPHSSCSMRAHTLCLASYFLGNEGSVGNHTNITNQEILPLIGKCSLCSEDILWGDVIRSSLQMYGYFENTRKETEENALTSVDARITEHIAGLCDVVTSKNESVKKMESPILLSGNNNGYTEVISLLTPTPPLNRHQRRCSLNISSNVNESQMEYPINLEGPSDDDDCTHSTLHAVDIVKRLEKKQEIIVEASDEDSDTDLLPLSQRLQARLDAAASENEDRTLTSSHRYII